MQPRCAPRCSSLIGLSLLLACSTPISFEPQVFEEPEEMSDGGPVDASLRDAEAGTYDCETVLPGGSNFFSLLSDGCATRPPRACRAAPARTSQEGVDLHLRDFVIGCGLPANFRLGATFDAQGCAAWVHYQDGPRLTPAQVQCLSNRLEAVRFDCDVRCALNANIAP